MTTYISVAKSLSSRERGIGIKGDSKGQVFRKIVQMDLDPDDYEIVESLDKLKVCYKAPNFLIKFGSKYINVNHIVSTEVEDVYLERPKPSCRVFEKIRGAGDYILKIKMVNGDDIFGFETEDERQKFIEMVDTRLYDINTYRRTCEGGR